MEEDSTIKKITKWKPIASGLKGRPIKWEEDIRKDLKFMKISQWKKIVIDRKQWSEIIELAKTHKECSALQEEKEEL